MNRGLAFAIGLLLPLMTVRLGKPGSVGAAPVDLICVLQLAWLFLRHRLTALPWPALLYLGAVVLSLPIALGATPGPAGEAWIGGAGLLTSFGFYVLGLSLGDSRSLLRWLLVGSALAMLGEGVGIGCQLMVSVRPCGSFAGPDALVTYGFCAAGMMMLGATLTRERFRIGFVLLGLAAAALSVTASRIAFLALLSWAVFVMVLGLRYCRQSWYRTAAASFAAIVFVLALFPSGVYRFWEGADGGEGGWTRLWTGLGAAERSFPLGFGCGRAGGMDGQNGLVSVLVELGVLGLIGYLGMALVPLRSSFPRRADPVEARTATLVAAFLLACVVFSLDASLYRDRTFLLFLGLATSLLRGGAEPPVFESRTRPSGIRS